MKAFDPTKMQSGVKFLAALPTAYKNVALEALAKALLANAPKILKANARDLASAKRARLSPAMQDRLRLDPSRLDAMAESVRSVAKLPDPVWEVVETKHLPNGLEAKRVRSPLGVILVVFESRPNVVTEVFSLCFKSGNAAILKSGKEAEHTARALFQTIQETLEAQKIPTEVCQGLPKLPRPALKRLLTRKDAIDLIIPRGGAGLIEFVEENTRIPILKNDRGVCHVYVHEDANLDWALQIVENAKVSRPSVCNSMETVLVHQKVVPTFWQHLFKKLTLDRPLAPVRWNVCPRTLKHLQQAFPKTALKLVKPATAKSYASEYLDLELNCRAVDDLDDAIAHIQKYGSGHSESIVTESAEASARFERALDSAAVYWNASTRFTDGFELGLGAEIGVSTQKLHARGPLGLRELTSVRWWIHGKGHVR